MNRLLIYALALCAAARTVHALDTLMVGGGTEQGTRNWLQVAESARFVATAEESIWTWTAEPGANLSPGLAERNGIIRAKMAVSVPGGGTMDILSERTGLSSWVDGDGNTAWGPDQDAEIERRAVIYIDLGATFRVDRIRFFPRLDSEHSGLILGSFEVGTNSGEEGAPLSVRYRTVPGLNFSSFAPNRQPLVDAAFERRDVRFIRLRSLEGEPWEIAEFEVYAEGSIPVGEFVSVPLFIRGGFPIWGRMLYDGGEVAGLPVAIQTRTGPDEEPLHYFLQRGDEFERVSREDYLGFVRLGFAGAAQVELGPIRPNPEWSPWQTVADGLVLSPAPRRYIQLRVLMPEPDTVIKNLFVEYVEQPLVDLIEAEISPLLVDAGVETEFTLSMEVHLNSGRGDTGFRYLEVRTPAAIGRVKRVLVDDQEVVATPTYQAGEGFTVDIWKRVIQSGSFVQVLFTATLLRDGTSFEVRALDLRPEEGEIETVYQTARPGDVDPFSVGGELVVRLRQDDAPLVDAVRAKTATFTPNEDGVNDIFEISYNLLKLTRSAPVFFQIFDLSGRLVVQGTSEERHGRFARIWNGGNGRGRLVEPGLYIYRIKVEADAGTMSRQGVVNVAY